jgi:hypothetical protein
VGCVGLRVRWGGWWRKRVGELAATRRLGVRRILESGDLTSASEEEQEEYVASSADCCLSLFRHGL